jgi:hypothetical protein
MSALSTHIEGVTAAERELLVSACIVERPQLLSGDIDPATGVETPGTPTVVFTGRCFVSRINGSQQVSVGGDVRVVERPWVGLSISAPALVVGDRITVTASPTPMNVGRELVVTGLPGGDLIVMARYEVEVLTG